MARIGIDARKVRDFGIGVYVTNLIHGLARVEGANETAAGNEYLLFVRPEDRDFAADLPPNFQCVVERSPVYSLREIGWMSWRIWRSRLDLYHATHYVLPAVVPCSTVVTIHDIIHLLYPGFLPNRAASLYAQGMFRHSVARADRIVAVSNNTRNDVLDYFSVDEDKVRVVYNGVEDRFRRPLPEDELRAALDEVGVRRPYLLFVGNPKPHKNLDRVIKAYAQAQARAGFDAPLVCVGARPGSDFKLERRARQVGIGDHIRLLGHVDGKLLPALYQGASLFLYPTLYEGFGLPVVEAMASGVPVITSNTSSLKEIAQGYAELVNPLEVKEIARAIERCMGNRNHAKQLADRAGERSARFRWEEAAESTLDIYREVLREAGD
ncbi:MAG: glycosyltransferase family 1 protein [Acidobacteriota bacterium]|nr:glycosyltransferase family 1 protein [Acidobacteriota bacterium]